MRRAPCFRALAVLSLSLYSYTAVHAQNDTQPARGSANLGILSVPIVGTASGPAKSSSLVSASASQPETSAVAAIPTSSEPTLPPYLSLPTSIVPSDDPIFAIINQSPARKTHITPGEAAIVCKSPSWELRLSNWIWSNAQEWLELYTLKYKDSYESGLDLAQGNVGLMAPKMAHTFFWWNETPDDQKRAVVLHFTIMGLQNIFKILSPFLPWLQVLDKLSKKLESYSADLQRAKENEHIAWLFMRTAHLLNVEWGWTMRNNRGVRTVNQERGFYLHATGFRGDRTERYWRDDYGKKRKHWWNYAGDEWTPSKRSFWKCNNEVWRTPRGGNWNAMDKYTINGWRRRKDESLEEGGSKIPPSHGEYTKLGYWQEKTKDFNDLVKWKEERDKDKSQLKVDMYKMGWSVFTGWIPEAFLGINMWAAHPESQDRSAELNTADLAMAIGKMTSNSRQGLRAGVAELMNPTNISETGETTLSVLLARGHYLPANDHILKSFAASDVEAQITKNVFFKTLNAALKAQQIYITCTAAHTKRKYPSKALGGIPALSCKQDNTGPQNLKACVPYTPAEAAKHGIGNGHDGGELACYMYKWAARGKRRRHHNEAPFGSEEWEKWGVTSADIITSSVRSYLMELEAYEIVNPMNAGTLRTAKSIAKPDTPGIFTVPVCVSRHNMNAPIESFSVLSELNPHSSYKHLPCDCGFWGEDTEVVWRDLGIWDQFPEHYRLNLCPRQMNLYTNDALERWVSGCRLSTKKSGGVRRFGRDSRCGVVTWLLSELKKRGVPAELPEPLRLAIWCRINKGWWSRLRECRDVTANAPWGSVIEELDGVVRRVGEENLGNELTESEFWKQIDETEPVEELLMKPFGLGSENE
ncbi:hypothetical protein C7212DRAFT_346241 [Tuber magnatum]|uniref:Enterotoxin n=1 Tax=Tuber magnatum TaxID=42249 RepID=A0A317SJY0_9PEZI|nr:hypothetical protein C7212DRAFT_346241 [Tuber magnatum]